MQRMILHAEFAIHVLYACEGFRLRESMIQLNINKDRTTDK